jgi:hypothetical protein
MSRPRELEGGSGVAMADVGLEGRSDYGVKPTRNASAKLRGAPGTRR